MPTAHKKEVSRNTHLCTPDSLGRDQASNLLWVDSDAYPVDVFHLPFRIDLPCQVGVVVNRLDIRKPLQARIKGCSTQPQTSSCLFSCKHSLFLHYWHILIRLIILIDKTNVKPYNTTWTSKTKRTSCHSQIIAMKRLLSKYQEELP